MINSTVVPVSNDNCTCGYCSRYRVSTCGKRMAAVVSIEPKRSNPDGLPVSIRALRLSSVSCRMRRA
ncbi:hypothetical protein D3C76_1431250 [compost metagenome]